MVICAIKEDNKDNSMGKGKPKGKLTKGAEKWTAQFKRNYEAEQEASTVKNQGKIKGKRQNRK